MEPLLSAGAWHLRRGASGDELSLGHFIGHPCAAMAAARGLGTVDFETLAVKVSQMG
jgi:hypothetical protein